MTMIHHPTRPTRAQHWLWLAPLLFVSLIGVYSVARYGGTWAEADSATFAGLVRPFVEQGQLVPRGQVYPNGFAFQSISAVLLALTGLDVATLQQLVYPLLAALTVLPAWLLYRELTGSPRGAALATVLLFTQPEFLFVVLRSSHEKFTRALMLLCLYLLVRSFQMRDHPRSFATHIALYYLTTFALIASNNLLANSFIAAIGLALLLGWLLALRSTGQRAADRAVLRRLVYVSAISMTLTFLITFFVYEPARHDVLIVKDTWQRVQDLFLQTQAGTADSATYTQAYTYISFGWLSIQVYLLVSIANWIMLVASFVIWTGQGGRWLRHKAAPARREQWLLWLLYAAFALQGAASVVIDASGALGTNLQHRLFPSFSIVAVGVVAAALARWQPHRFGELLRLGMAAAVFCVAVLSVLKATNEPLLSNKWTFYRPEELAALEWTDAHLEQARVWTEFDERLSVAYTTARGYSPRGNGLRSSGIGPNTRHVLVTDVARLRGQRLGAAPPVPPNALQIYDNGAAQLYRVRPFAPFERYQ